MTLLFICDEYPPGANGGIGSSVQTLARQLVKLGHRVFVAGLYSHGYGQPNEAIDQGVHVFRKRYGIPLPVPTNHRLYNIRHKLPEALKSRMNGKKAFTGFVAFLIDLIAREKVDVVEIADYNNFCEHIGITVAWPPLGVPLVVKSHGSHTYFCHEQGIATLPRLEQTDRLLFSRADAICSVSTYTGNVNQHLFGKHPNTTLYNGLDITPETSALLRSDSRVVFTGSITPKKGVFQLVKAWNKVRSARADAELSIFGKGKTDALRRLLLSQHRASVHFEGHVSKDTLLKHLSTAAVAVFPSYTETFGLGPVEAMSRGCAVIYTRRSCGPEIVTDGVDGLLVDPDNTEEIAQTIVELLNNPEKRKQLGAAAKQTVNKRFHIDVVAKNHIEFYSRVVASFKSHPHAQSHNQ